MTDEYRVRATKAEQQVAILKRQLMCRPKYEWFVASVRRTLAQSDDVSAQHLAHQVRQLKAARWNKLELADKAAEVLREASRVYRLYNATQMPDGNLVDEQTLQELADLLGR